MPHPKPNALPHVEVLVLRKNLLFSIFAQFDQPMLIKTVQYMQNIFSFTCSKGYRIRMLTSTLTDACMRLPYFDKSDFIATMYNDLDNMRTVSYKTHSSRTSIHKIWKRLLYGFAISIICVIADGGRNGLCGGSFVPEDYFFVFFYFQHFRYDLRFNLHPIFINMPLPLYLRARPYLNDDPSTMCSASCLNCSYRKSSQWGMIDPEGMVHCKLA
ncbi:hypothetical protein ALC53_03333 [Atta colombica]|uniref:Uncharacterized protein n=1 Tax=Atta colombica TaxID=520822 RepID=A0A195BN30_9HYME|nr:hypothetical protein ALC53_03333 [Atta colombica]